LTLNLRIVLGLRRRADIDHFNLNRLWLTNVLEQLAVALLERRSQDLVSRDNLIDTPLQNGDVKSA
jgi:hypothetical protein